jgi:hypothetical protein
MDEWNGYLNNNWRYHYDQQPEICQTAPTPWVRFKMGALLFFGRADCESARGAPAPEPDP